MDIILKKVVGIFWMVSKTIQGCQSCIEMFLDSGKQLYGFDLQPKKTSTRKWDTEDLFQKCFLSCGKGKVVSALNKTCKAIVAGRVKA